VTTTNLHIELICDSLELSPVLHEIGQVNVHGSAHSCSKVSGARGDVADVRVVKESGFLFDGSCGSCQTCENFTYVCARLHRDDTKFIFFVDPDEEGFGLIVENTATLGPVAVKSASFEEAITLLEEEVVSNKLLLVCLRHAIKRIESACKITGELRASINYGIHDFVALIVCDSWAKREGGEISSNSNSC